MTLRKAIIIICLLFFCEPLFAQATDTLPHVDTPVINKEVTDTNKTPKVIQDNDTGTHVTAHKGYVINGKVADANTGEGIPFATIVFRDNSTGNAADQDGNFIFKLARLPSETLIIRAIGY